MASSVLAIVIAAFLFAYFFFFPNRIVYHLQDFTTFFLSSCRILVRPKYQGHIDYLSRILDRLYKQTIRDQTEEIEKGLKELKKAEKELRNLAGLGGLFGFFGNHLTALAEHAEVLSGYLGNIRDLTTDSGSGIGIIMVIGKHTPLVGLAFAALHPVLKVCEMDAETKKIVEETIGNIGDLVNATKKTRKRILKAKIRLDAKELEEINLLLEMIEDGCDKLRIVVEDRKTSFWRRFGRSSRHQDSLKSWNDTVKHLLEFQDRQRLNVVYYRTRLLLDRSKTHTMMLLFVSITTLVVLKLLIDIKHHLEEPFYACVAKALIEIGRHLEPFREIVLGFVSSIPPHVPLVLKHASIQYFE